MAAIAMLGVGAMGARMAQGLLRAGHDVTVWNRTPDRAEALQACGARVALSPRAAATGADFVISMVRDNHASEYVWLDHDAGALAVMSESAIGIESSTLTTAWVRQLASRFANAGRDFLDAPVAGSRPQADAAQLIYFVGGDADVLTRAAPVVRVMGSTIHHAGPVGAGAATKLAVNTLFGIQVAALAEIIAGLITSDLDPARSIDILGSTPVCSAAAKVAAGAMLAGNFAPLFPIELVEKDLGYALDAAEANPGDLPLTTAAQQIFADANLAGLGDLNLTAIIRRYDKDNVNA